MLACAWTTEAHAQDGARAEVTRWIFPGSEAENYLRYLQTLGMVKEYPWSVRAFSSDELRRLQPKSDAHPWASAPQLLARPAVYKGMRLDIAPATIDTWYNTAFPFGMNDGAVWAGRGLTSAVSGGASARWGPIEVTLAPTAFWAENRSFAMLATPGYPEFADPLYPKEVDRPQRFGRRPYGRIDPGQSTVRLDLLGIGLGISTANQWWGPMSEFPYILGTNAPGFAHVFVGTSHPLNILIGRVHGRVLYGRLEQTQFSPVDTGNGSRFASGLVATFQPRVFPGLEVGASRFFHVAWPDSGLSKLYFTHLFETFLKRRIKKDFLLDPVHGSSTDNQLASAFARWTLARSGFEVYGEYGRDDHNVDTYDLLLEPDHSAMYGIGLRKAWRNERSLMALLVEIINFESSTLDRHRGEDAIYVHAFTPQGHTNRGQLLGTGIGVANGAGSTVALERFDSSGSASVTWSRFAVRERPGSVQGMDVQHVLRIARRLHQGRGSLDWCAAVDGVYDLNRNFAGDKLNVRAELSTTWHR